MKNSNLRFTISSQIILTNAQQTNNVFVELNIVKEKYDFAFTTNRSRFNTNKHNKYLLPRIDMGKKISKFKLYLKAFTPYEDILSN